MPAMSREDLASAELLPPMGPSIVVHPDASIRQKLTASGSIGFEDYFSIPLDQPEPFGLVFDGKAWADDEVADFLRERKWGVCLVYCLDRSSHWPSTSLDRYLRTPKRTTWKLVVLTTLLVILAVIGTVIHVYATPGFVVGLVVGALAAVIIFPLAIILAGKRELKRRTAERYWRLGL